ncbi:MAG: SIS domain-containing protein [Chloroflexi bacterium]|nr:SIS domain-containing protein [Chloroflexota bacterium]
MKRYSLHASRPTLHSSQMDFIDSYLATLSQSVGALSRDDLRKACDALMVAWREERAIFIIGNGGSAATASHMMNDLNKLTITPGKHRFRAIALTDNMPLVTAWSNDSSFAVSFAEPLRNLMRPGDFVIAISTSGNSPNILKAIETAYEIGGTVIALVGDVGGKLADMADIVIRFPDPHQGRQEDGHLIMNHIIAGELRQRMKDEG